MFRFLLPSTSIGLCVLFLGLCRPAIAADETQSDAAVLDAIFGETLIAENVAAVRARARALRPAERFEFLLASLLPKSGDGTIRLAGAFTQTDPAPVLQHSSDRQTAAGGEIVSPAYDLLDVGRELGRLDEVLERVESLPNSTSEFQQRARASLRLLINLELGRRDAADMAADELLRLVLASTPTTIAEMWPETLAVYRGVDRHRADRAIGDLLTTIYHRRSHGTPLPGIDVWHAQLSALTHTQATRVIDFGLHPLEVERGRRFWHPVGRHVSQSRGIGFPQAVWMRTDRELHHVSGHNVDYLFYGCPLRGDYEVEADVYGPGVTQFIVAGRILGMSANRRGITIGTFQKGTAAKAVEPAWGRWNPWVRYRAVVRKGTLTVSLDGRQVHTEPLPEQHDPWVGVHSGARSYARIRDIRITGTPEVPKSVTLSAIPDLRSWVSYHGESINVAGGAWEWEANTETGNGQIIARADNSLTGTFAESLLRYQRPLIEDASITYDFFYQPGQSETHPALDRLAFLLRPQGVSEHWITDRQYDTTTLGPENIFEKPKCRRGPNRLPLRSGEWNRMKLSIAGDTASLELNGALIYERDLESTNRRTFGLFRYADKGVRVRNVVMRGDWPTSVPAPADQKYADAAIAAIDAALPQLSQRLDHDFSRDGLPARIFQIPPGHVGPQLTPDGAMHTVRTTGDGAAVAVIDTTVELHGDFDVSLQFGDFEGPALNSDCGLRFVLGDKHGQLIRRHGQPTVERVLATFVTPTKNGGARPISHHLTTEARGGTFRLVRRGDTLSALFADNDSTAFRLFAEHTWENCREIPARLDIRTTARNRGETRVAWQRFHVAAERLMRIPTEKPKPVVFTANTDGTEFKQLTEVMPQFRWHGSPEWSPDGKRIAFDAWTGSAGSSRIYIVNDDGSGLQDLGVGIIPTFSPDGKKLAFTWSGRGTTVMNVDGTGRKVLTEEGWGCQWSPDGRWLAYGSYNRLPQGGGAANLTLIDVDTREKRLLLEGVEASRYTQIHWNMAWSPDGGQIIFKGDRRRGAEAAIVSVEGSGKAFRIVTSDNISSNFAWHPDGRRILISQRGKLHYYDAETKQVDQLPGQPEGQSNAGGVLDPAGKRIVFIGVPKPKAVPW